MLDRQCAIMRHELERAQRDTVNTYFAYVTREDLVDCFGNTVVLTLRNFDFYETEADARTSRELLVVSTSHEPIECRLVTQPADDTQATAAAPAAPAAPTAAAVATSTNGAHRASAAASSSSSSSSLVANGVNAVAQRRPMEPKRRRRNGLANMFDEHDDDAEDEDGEDDGNLSDSR